MERIARAWLTIVVIQAMGSVWMCYSKQNAASHYTSSLTSLSRAHALPLALLCVLRMILIFDFRNISIHIAHIFLSIITAIHTMSEVFFYQTMTYGIVTLMEVAFNSFSVAVMLSFLCSTSFEAADSEEKVKRSRKITAKHYMEGEMLSPDEDNELVQAYKKWK